MTLSDARQQTVNDALRRIRSEADAACAASDLDAAKAALNRVWFAVHDAHDTLTEAERETRREALARIGEPA